MRLAGNTVLVTGGSSGIGYALAAAFIAAGSTVVVCARGRQRLAEARRRQPQLHVHPCDVADQRSRDELVAWIADRFPRLNILVNNAGVQRDLDFTQGVAGFLAGDNEIRVNLEAPVILTAMLVPLLARNPRAGADQRLVRPRLRAWQACRSIARARPGSTRSRWRCACNSPGWACRFSKSCRRWSTPPSIRPGASGAAPRKAACVPTNSPPR